MKRSLKISLVSLGFVIVFLAAWIFHDHFTGAMLPTWQDPTPEIEAKMATHVPISKSLFNGAAISLLVSISSAVVFIFQKVHEGKGA